MNESCDSAWYPRFMFLCAHLLIFKGLTASLISQSGSFALPVVQGLQLWVIPQSIKIINRSLSGQPGSFAVMGGTGTALLSQSTLIHSPQAITGIMLPSPILEELPSGLSHNLLNR